MQGSSPSVEITLGAESTDVGASGSALELPAGHLIGRHVIVERLGAGGMGVVYAAYDPQLDRRIAIKLLRDPSDPDGHGRAWMLHEAQALARLAHPNVVGIHDVGIIDDRVWIAMEYVEGETLWAWCGRTKPSWREVLEVMIAAGRGLAAAHAVGLVHRDFKPDNVMVAERVRVMDFGVAFIASAADEEREPTSREAAAEPSRTRADALIGTPGYMAPEQLHRRAVDAKSDQFAFCITLWEALYGARPFAGDTVIELSSAVLQGRLREPPDGSRVPRWLREIVTRGLATDPAERFASMDVLLDALARGQGRARRRIAFAAAGLLALVVAGALAQRASAAQSLREGCRSEAATIGELWPGVEDARRTAIGEAMTASGLPFAADTAARSGERLDRFAAEWAELRAQACIADGGVAAPLGVTRACLDEQRDGLASLLDVLGEADRAAIVSAVSVTSSLGPLRDCEDPRSAQNESASHDPAQREAERTSRAELSRVHSLSLVGRAREAVEVAAQAVAAAEQAGSPILLASAHGMHSDALFHTDDFAGAAKAAQRSFAIALGEGRDGLAARNASRMVLLLGYRLGRPDEALEWADIGGALVHRGGLEGAELDAQIRHHRAIVLALSGDPKAAIAEMEAAMAIATVENGADHPYLAQMSTDLGTMYFMANEPRLALEHHTRALDAYVASLGPGHPTVGTMLGSMGAAHAALGEQQRAIECFERALAIAEAMGDAMHSSVGLARMNLGGALVRAGEHARAVPLLEGALAIFDRDPTIHARELPELLTALGEARLALGERAAAITALERAAQLAPEGSPERAAAQKLLARARQ